MEEKKSITLNGLQIRFGFVVGFLFFLIFFLILTLSRHVIWHYSTVKLSSH